MIRKILLWSLARTREKRLRKEWRMQNAHNTTRLGWLPPSKESFRKIRIGRCTYGAINAIVSDDPSEALEIGHFCSIASDVEFLLGSEHSYRCLSTFPFKVKCAGEKSESFSKGPIILEDDVWIGERCLILSGTRIGKGAVVAAGSVVAKDVAPYAIVGGVPAKFIKYRFSPAVVKKLVDGLDWSRLDGAHALEGLDLFYREVTEENVDSIIQAFNSLTVRSEP